MGDKMDLDKSKVLEKPMKASIGIRKSEDRTDIGKVAPLSTPFVVFIDPCSACNFSCTFCPTGDHELIKSIGRFQGVLKLHDYEKILRDLNDFASPIKVLRLYKDGEPLLNKNFPMMVELASKHHKIEKIDTTTNGALLNESLSEKIIRAGINRINISIDGLDENQVMSFTDTKIDYKNFIKQIAYLYSVKGECEIVIKTTSEIVGKNRSAEFFEIFGNYSDKIFIENTSPCWPEFDVEERMGIEISEGLYGNEINEVEVCPYLFYSISVNSDMKVSACFVDWSRELTIGDLRNESLQSIWNGPKLASHRLSHLELKRKNHKVCGSCGQISHCGPDNIDSDREYLLERMTTLGKSYHLDESILKQYAFPTIHLKKI
jgi:radical SAM protein with 4Fe4S-binding SPASM domain